MINWKNNKLPEAPYCANIVNYFLSDDLEGYQKMDDITLDFAHKIDGFLGWRVEN